MRLVVGPMTPEEEKGFDETWTPLFRFPHEKLVDWLNALNPLLGQYLATRASAAEAVLGFDAAQLEAAAAAGAGDAAGVAEAMQSAALAEQLVAVLVARLEATVREIEALGPPPDPDEEQRRRHARHVAAFRLSSDFPFEGEWFFERGSVLRLKLLDGQPDGTVVVLYGRSNPPQDERSKDMFTADLFTLGTPVGFDDRWPGLGYKVGELLPDGRLLLYTDNDGTAIDEIEIFRLAGDRLERVQYWDAMNPLRPEQPRIYGPYSASAGRRADASGITEVSREQRAEILKHARSNFGPRLARWKREEAATYAGVAAGDVAGRGKAFDGRAGPVRRGLRSEARADAAGEEPGRGSAREGEDRLPRDEHHVLRVAGRGRRAGRRRREGHRLARGADPPPPLREGRAPARAGRRHDDPDGRVHADADRGRRPQPEDHGEAGARPGGLLERDPSRHGPCAEAHRHGARVGARTPHGLLRTAGEPRGDRLGRPREDPTRGHVDRDEGPRGARGRRGEGRARRGRLLGAPRVRREREEDVRQLPSRPLRVRRPGDRHGLHGRDGVHGGRADRGVQAGGDDLVGGGAGRKRGDERLPERGRRELRGVRERPGEGEDRRGRGGVHGSGVERGSDGRVRGADEGRVDGARQHRRRRAEGGRAARRRRSRSATSSTTSASGRTRKGDAPSSAPSATRRTSSLRPEKPGRTGPRSSAFAARRRSSTGRSRPTTTRRSR